jgi:hypothetical protein
MAALSHGILATAMNAVRQPSTAGPSAPRTGPNTLRERARDRTGRVVALGIVTLALVGIATVFGESIAAVVAGTPVPSQASGPAPTP